MGKENKQTTNELNQFVPAGIKWLYEMEAVNSPVLLNNLYGNIFSYPNVKDAEILIDKHNRKMLIYIEFNWLSRKIFKSRRKETTVSILDQLQELLPSFTFRIIEDRGLFELALARMTEQLTGGKDVKANESTDVVEPNPTAEPIQPDAILPHSESLSDSTASQPEVTESDSKKSSET